MSLQLLLRDQPQRSIALTTSTHALVFRKSSPTPRNRTQQQTSTVTAAPRYIVEFSPLSAVDLADYRHARSSVHGTLGLVNVGSDVFLCIITASTKVATVRQPNENVQKIVAVEFYCLNRNDFDDRWPNERDGDGDDGYFDTYDPHVGNPNSHEATVEHPCLALKKLLSAEAGGTFYYSVDFDLTNRLQDRSSEESAFDIDKLDEDFLWNSYMIGPLLQFRSRLSTQDRTALDGAHILTSAIRGFVSTITVPASSSPIKSLPSHLPSSLTLISRLSCRRAGTRFNSRGIDDDGNVANFVETETVYWYPSGICYSYVQVRGSIPIFWEQTAGLLPNQQKIQITRSVEATQPAFDKHFHDLLSKYSTVHILNLLSETKPGEVELTERYNYHINHTHLNANSATKKSREPSNHMLIQKTEFDFHAETRGSFESANLIRRKIQAHVDGFAYFLSDTFSPNDVREKEPGNNMAVILQQEGVFRTNCLDCLDRTNLIQTIVSRMALEAFLSHRGEQGTPDFWTRHSTLWADNGDALSKIYAGTGALKSSFTRHGKMSLAGAFADARKSATRMYINNFVDKGRQNTIDILLGRLVDQVPVQLYDPVTDWVNSEMKKKASAFTSEETIRILVGTFNLNGKGHGTKEDLSAWLCPRGNAIPPPEIVVVAFQEIVELSPQQIMSTDPARRQDWETAVTRTLNEDAKRRGTEPYILLRSGQLVGAALLVLVQSPILRCIKNVEGSIKKTGLSGMAGNKGAVAIRLDYSNTSICFVTSHLAAGFANYDERNKDYQTISSGLRFQRNRAIEDHETVIWLGDFNYRIGLNNEYVRQLVAAGDLETLFQNDQLNLQMVAGHVFPYYSESSITFLPTYKYDNGTDNYDSSEKARIPAWTDRILRKGENLRQIDYTTAPLKFSDHRPVWGSFECTVSNVDVAAKERLSRNLFARRRASMGEDVIKDQVSDEDDDEDVDAQENKSIAPGLPPASSTRQKWWLNDGLPARSTVANGHDGQIPNPDRSANPFKPSSQPEWIPKPVVTQQPTLPTRQSSRKLSPSYSPSNRQPPPDSQHARSAPRAPNRPSITPPLRKASTDSVASSIGRKPAPPVPKKPSNFILLPDQLDGSQHGPRGSARGPPTSQGSQPTISPPVRRMTAPLNMPDKAHGSALQYSASSATRPNRSTIGGTPPPNLPPRSNMNLLDEEDDEANSIPTLKPLRPG
ncbi:inositol polyphosphate 5-phosphatase [Agyrium rufum]|nr:inositol polyphosphate 5-phosphatase [Agyrium rufum]